MLKKLEEAAEKTEHHAELRYHARKMSSFKIRNGDLREADNSQLAGLGVRVLADGCWGFVSTSELSQSAINKAVKEAEQAALEAGKIKQDKIDTLAEAEMAEGEFITSGAGEENDPPMSQKMEDLLNCERNVRESGDNVIGSVVSYTKYQNEKYIFTSDGARAHIKDQKSDVSLTAFGMADGQRERTRVSSAVTGGWQKLFAEESLDELAGRVIEKLNRKLGAKQVSGGRYKVILDPALVGVLAHEAIGHTVEADFVESGSVVKDRLGEKVAGDLINMVDDGSVEGVSGQINVDDEGVKSQRTTIIEDGILKNYLHNRESAARFDSVPRGNARAFNYNDEPLIRMTNTFILPGESKLSEMIEDIDDGLYLVGLGQGGQADATAEFMFDVSEGYKIESGELSDPVKGVTISGQAFDVLKSVDAVSDDFEFGLGRGYCGKMQRAKVDAGGPYIRCEVMVGGGSNDE